MAWEWITKQEINMWIITNINNESNNNWGGWTWLWITRVKAIITFVKDNMYLLKITCTCTRNKWQVVTNKKKNEIEEQQ